MNNKNINSPENYFIAAFIAIIISILSYFGAVYFQNGFFSNNVIIGDLAAYYSIPAPVYTEYLTNGFLSAMNLALDSYHFSLKLIIALLANPELLINIDFNVLFNIICSTIFLILFNIYIYRYSKSFIWTILATILFCSLPNYLHYTFGLAGNFADISTAYLLAASLLALLLSEGKIRPWLILFGLLAGLTVLNRYASIGLIAFIELPVLITYFTINYKLNKSLREIFNNLIAVSIPFFIVLGFYLVKKIYGFIYTYFYIYTAKSHITHIFSSLSNSIDNGINSFTIMFGLRGLGLLILLFIAFLIVFRKRLILNSKIFINLWLLISLPLLFIFILRIVEIWEYFLYIIQVYAIVFAHPVDLKDESSESQNSLIFNKLIYIVLISTILVNLSWNVYSIQQQVITKKVNTSLEETFDMKYIISLNINNIVSSNYSKLKKKPIPAFEVFIDSKGFYLSPSIFNDLIYKYRKLVQWKEYFSVWETGWEKLYNSNDSNIVKNSVLHKINDSLDLVVIMAPESEYNLKASVFNQPDFKGLNIKYEKALFNYLFNDSLNWKKEQLTGVNSINLYMKDIRIFRNMRLFRTYLK